MTRKRPDFNRTAEMRPSEHQARRPEPVSALDAAIRDAGAETRAELVRAYLRAAVGV